MIRGIEIGNSCFVWGGHSDKIGNVYLEKLGSGLVVQRFPFGWMVELFALYHLGMAPGDGILKGFGSVDVHDFFSGVQSHKIMKMQHEHGRI